MARAHLKQQLADTDKAKMAVNFNAPFRPYYPKNSPVWKSVFEEKELVKPKEEAKTAELPKLLTGGIDNATVAD